MTGEPVGSASLDFDEIVTVVRSGTLAITRGAGSLEQQTD